MGNSFGVFYFGKIAASYSSKQFHM